MMYCRRHTITARDLLEFDVERRAVWTAPQHRCASFLFARGLSDTAFPLPVPPPELGTDSRGLIDMVAMLEAAAIALGAPDLSAQSIQTARAADRELRACHRDAVAAAHWARLFHHTLLGSCPNRHMLDLIEVESLEPGPATRTLDIGVEEFSRVADDHESILDMIATDAPRCEIERSLRRHTSESTLCSLAHSAS
jgi:DNA-binding GntR family transcriptional regulator